MLTNTTHSSRLSFSSTGGTDGTAEVGTTSGGGCGVAGCSGGLGGDADSSDDGTNCGAAVTSVANEEESNMPEEVFKWMTHSVNQDFIRLGYPSILTETADREFVSLSPLIQNCSAVLTLLKARRSSTVADHKDVITDNRNASAATTTNASSSLTSRRKHRRWGLFSGKQNRRNGARQQQPQPQQKQQVADPVVAGLHESMARKMRRDTERIIRRTGCLDARALQAAGLLEPAPYPEGSAERSDFAFVRSTWRSFRKLAQARIVECAQTVKEAEELRRQLTEAKTEVERLQSVIDSQQKRERNLEQQQQQQPSSPEPGGRLQRVGGFLRRAVSRERLTFGRTSLRQDAPVSEVRSRASSQPPPARAAAAEESNSELHRLRAEYDRRERLLLAEREKLRQANSKLTFRIQYLSGLASVAAKQQQQHHHHQAGAGADQNVRSERRLRRAERRVLQLRREASELRKSLSTKTEALVCIAAAATHLQRHTDSSQAEADGLETANDTCQSALPPLEDEPPRLAKFVESTCQKAATRLQRLQRQCADAEARAAALAECLRPTAAAAAVATNAASSEPVTDVNDVEQTKLDLRDRIINQLTAKERERQAGMQRLKDLSRVAGDSGDVSHRSVFSETMNEQQQKQKQQQQQHPNLRLQQQQQPVQRMRRASHDPRSQRNSFIGL